MDDLWSEERGERRASAAPLAARMRPAELDEVVGQEHLLGADAAFRSIAESARPLSMILWGPPGSGKTTLARLVARETGAKFEALSATSAGVKDVREVLAAAAERLGESGVRTILFLDEIHRFTKAQQDALLPGVEEGTVVLVGATTENPFFEVNSPLLSRCTLFRLEPLQPDSIEQLIDRALVSPQGFDGQVVVDDGAKAALAERVGGDVRLAFNTLEVAAALASDGAVGQSHIEEALQRRIIRYDKKGDEHYDVISAFIKSVRGSDVDGSLYWLHTMLEAGEDPEFIVRRMIILASEDIGLADSAALGVAVDAARALAYVGLPEATFALTHAAIYLAAAPKSNSVKTAIGSARQAVSETSSARVPPHLRSAPHSGQQAMGDGVGYAYPHDDSDGVVAQQYLPDEAAKDLLYRPIRRGDEVRTADQIEAADSRLGKQPRDPNG